MLLKNIELTKKLRLTASLHSSSTMKLQKSSDTEFVDLAELAMSDLDESDTVFEEFS